MTSQLLAVTAANHTATPSNSAGANAQSESAAPFSDVLSQAHTLTKGRQTPQDTSKQTGSALTAKTDLKALQAALAKTLQQAKTQPEEGKDAQQLLSQLAQLDPQQQQKLLASLNVSLNDKGKAPLDGSVQALTESLTGKETDKENEQAGQAAISALLAMLPNSLPKALSDTPVTATSEPALPLLSGENKKDASRDLHLLLKTDKPDAELDEQQISLPITAASSKKVDPSALKSAVETKAVPTNATDIPLKLAAQPENALPQHSETSALQPAHAQPHALTNITASSPVITNTIAAPTTPLPTPVLNAQLGSSEWQQALGQQIMMFNRNGQHSAELRLHPQDLGTLQISLRIDDNQAQLHMASGHSQVRAALEAALPQLRTALADSGIQLGQSSVGSDAQPQWNGSQQNSADRQATSGVFSISENHDDAVIATTVASKSVRVGGVDISV
ncbi:flagellar hook-length control protein FliK [Hafnia paralvei]|jgi:flagellar hook-length control protein FliK|uniref:flagellar hook-length control protein FliK n=1 Tax=Hafnia paralvei TaxID=546367 RepID=UPI0015850834|nr:flagellar hook-length control protein FliK [Hafnia paralvei]MCE9878989.1 flagellar hook-length control protein FliK [Hafnia paralvei]MCE9909425.1 flagellar hook-length control protein FliK [Hafnia paralvei]MCE9912932.1 flagellar hook-length control protein FliK [Hafnia paralvei]NUN40045.1 flagellar hook-length control protein FliK [Hafnia paralvei]